MNAKKIMGAVLVALLAAALFVGAGAAAGSTNTVFYYQDITGQLTPGVYTSEDGKSSFTIGASTQGITNLNLPEGKYTFNDGTDDHIIYLTKPTAEITAFILDASNNPVVSVLGGKATTDNKIQFGLTIPVTTPGSMSATYYYTTPDNVKTTDNGAVAVSGQANTFTDFAKGVWKVQALFSDAGFLPGVPDSLLVGTDVYTFTIGSTTPTISASADTLVQGEYITVTIIGEPDAQFALYNKTVFSIPAGQAGVGSATVGQYTQITLNNLGTATISMKALAKTDDFELILRPLANAQATPVDTSDDVSVTITVEKGAITAEAEEDSYFIGDDIELFGTNTITTADLHFYIEGTNFNFQGITADYDIENAKWTATIDGADIRNLNPDTGSYTIYVSVNPGTKDVVKAGTYTTVVVKLKQPFISVTEAPEVVVMDADAVIKGTADATSQLGFYVFGTNFFYYTNETVPNAVEIKIKNNDFTITVDGDVTKTLDAGQYFAVIQHPMYDGLLNIWAESTSTEDIIKSAETVRGVLGAEKSLFDVKDRQKANAAQALCDALDSESIDDMYVKLSFVVAAGTSTINPIPSEIAQGEKLIVSGSTNMGEGVTVTVEMLSTAFAAVPKDTVGSASFISLVTKTDKDGNWEVTFDTTGLNIDEYTITAAVDQLASSSTAKINVVEAAPEQPDTPDTPDVPDTPDTPDTPDVPETPGFGALAALAGLGAVAVLLLRRE